MDMNNPSVRVGERVCATNPGGMYVVGTVVEVREGSLMVEWNRDLTTLATPTGVTVVASRKVYIGEFRQWALTPILLPCEECGALPRNECEPWCIARPVAS